MPSACLSELFAFSMRRIRIETLLSAARCRRDSCFAIVAHFDIARHIATYSAGNSCVSAITDAISLLALFIINTYFDVAYIVSKVPYSSLLALVATHTYFSASGPVYMRAFSPTWKMISLISLSSAKPMPLDFTAVGITYDFQILMLD